MNKHKRKGAIARRAPPPKPAPLPPRQIRMTESFSGPVPHPDLLAKYDAIVPGAGERFLAAFEREGAHRHTMDREHIDLERERIAIERQQQELDRQLAAGVLAQFHRGQWIGAVTALAMAGLAVFAITHDMPWVAGTAITSTAGIVTLFLSRRGRRAAAKKDWSKGGDSIAPVDS